MKQHKLVKKVRPKPENIGLWFYKTYINQYYQGGIESEDSEGQKEGVSKEITEKLALQFDLYNQYYKYICNQSTLKDLKLTTTYPGLVAGIGYEHEVGIPNELKLGFSFDHTTGLPVIPGSSVKGLLRSAFRHPEYIKSMLPNTLTVNIQDLEAHLFDGIDYSTREELNTYQRTIFWDAGISKSNNIDNKFLGDDYITSHQNTENPRFTPFTEPNPVRFIKVLPNVEFRFCFRLHPIQKDETEILSVDNQLKLFESILKDLGIGAKTNVGYGQFKYEES